MCIRNKKIALLYCFQNKCGTECDIVALPFSVSFPYLDFLGSSKGYRRHIFETATAERVSLAICVGSCPKMSIL